MVGVTDYLIANPACVDENFDGTKSCAGIPLITAMQKGNRKKGNLEIFDLLLRCGANVNVKESRELWGGGG